MHAITTLDGLPELLGQNPLPNAAVPYASARPEPNSESRWPRRMQPLPDPEETSPLAEARIGGRKLSLAG